MSCTEGSVCNLTVTFTDADPDGVASDYAATIDWGDGSFTSAGTIVANAQGGFSVTGSHTYAKGTYIASTGITDSGSVVVINTNVTVADAQLSAFGTRVAAAHGTPLTNAVMATFIDADPNGTVGDYTATIAWGDATSSAGTVVANGNGGFNVTGTHTYSAAGSQTATITINDAGGSSATATSTVADDFPLTATGCRLHVRLGQPFANLVVASFSDADPGGAAGSFSAAIDWGDGTASGGTIVNVPSGFNVLGSHAYNRVGSWNIRVTIIDLGGDASATVISTARLFPRASSY